MTHVVRTWLETQGARAHPVDDTARGPCSSTGRLDCDRCLWQEEGPGEPVSKEYEEAVPPATIYDYCELSFHRRTAPFPAQRAATMCAEAGKIGSRRIPHKNSIQMNAVFACCPSPYLSHRVTSLPRYPKGITWLETRWVRALPVADTARSQRSSTGRLDCDRCLWQEEGTGEPVSKGV